MGREDEVDRIIEQWRRQRPDLDLEAMELFGRLARVFAFFGKAIDATFENRGLLRGEYDVLATLRRSGNPYRLTPSELAATLMLSRAGMTNRLDRLEAAGWISRRHNSDDRRSTHIDLTSDGLALVDELTTAHVANETALLSGLTATERRQLNGIARKWLRRFEEDEYPSKVAR